MHSVSTWSAVLKGIHSLAFYTVTDQRIARQKKGSVEQRGSHEEEKGMKEIQIHSILGLLVSSILFCYSYHLHFLVKSKLKQALFKFIDLAVFVITYLTLLVSMRIATANILEFQTSRTVCEYCIEVQVFEDFYMEVRLLL